MDLHSIHQLPKTPLISKVGEMDPVINSPKKEFNDRYIDTISPALLDPHTKITKPAIAPSFTADITPPAIIFSRMMDAMQDYVIATAEPAELKQDQIGSKITKTKQTLRKAEASLLDTKKITQSWENRKIISNYIFHAASLMTGVGLTAAGQPWAGGSLIASSVGGASSNLMESYGFDSTLTGAISIASGVVGLVGGLGAGAYNLWSNPRALIEGLQGSASFSAAMQAAGTLTSFFSNGFTHYANIQKNNNLETLSNLEALHTKTDTTLKSLTQKHTGAATSFQSTAKNFSSLFKTIARAQTRYTRDVMRMLTADFPA